MKNASDQASRLEKATQEISVLSATINEKNEAINSLSSQKVALDATIVSLRQKEAQLETSLKSAETNIDEQVSRNTALENALNDSLRSNEEMGKKIERLETSIHEKNKEIVRLSNIKWYQKLFGKK